MRAGMIVGGMTTQKTNLATNQFSNEKREGMEHIFGDGATARQTGNHCEYWLKLPVSGRATGK